MLAVKLDISTDGRSDDRRGDERNEVGAPSVLRFADGSRASITVRNVSSGGLLLTSARHLPIGVQVQVGLSGSGVAEAKVVHRSGDDHGIEFVAPLSLAQLAGAFTSDQSVIDLFPGRNGVTLAEPVIRPWSPKVRVAAIIGAAVASWALVGWAVAAVVG